MTDKNSEILTYSEKTALDGEIAFAVSTSPHNAEMLYRLYMICKDIKEELRPYLITSIKSIVTLPEEEIDRVMLEIGSEEPPLWLWINRTISDLIFSVKPSELTYSIDSLKINKKEARKNLVRSSFTRFIREVSICCSPAAKLLCERVQQTPELEFLHMACFYLLEEIKELEIVRPPKSRIPFTILDMSFDIKRMLSFMAEREILSKIDKSEDNGKEGTTNNEAETEVPETVINEISKAQKVLNDLAEAMKSAADEITNTSEDLIYVVTKSYNSSDVSTPLRTFKSEKEAKEFINTLITNFPELQKSCKFTISKKSRKKGI